MTRIELTVLRRFDKSSIINNEEEQEILRRYASTGMVEFGFNFRTGQPMAKLTRQGKWFVKASLKNVTRREKWYNWEIG